MINLGKTHDTLSVVNDQIGTPTYTYDLARLLVDMIETEKYGYYHATNEGGYISWYDFTKEIFRQAAAMGHPEYLPENMTVNSVTTAEYSASKAARRFHTTPHLAGCTWTVSERTGFLTRQSNFL